jgi:GNAT superfamily N-acetyltransferase
VKIRPALLADSSSIAPLLAELGYPREIEEVTARLRRLGEVDGAEVLVVDDDGTVIALLAFHVIELLERPRPTCRITALVTAASHRRKGAASLLLEAVSTLAEGRGCERLEVTTKPERAEALSLYLGHDFFERPRRLVKYLDG